MFRDAAKVSVWPQSTDNRIWLHACRFCETEQMFSTAHTLAQQWNVTSKLIIIITKIFIKLSERPSMHWHRLVCINNNSYYCMILHQFLQHKMIYPQMCSQQCKQIHLTGKSLQRDRWTVKVHSQTVSDTQQHQQMQLCVLSKFVLTAICRSFLVNLSKNLKMVKMCQKASSPHQKPVSFPENSKHTE